MSSQEPRPYSTRETFLTVLLLTLVVGGFFVFFIGIMGMFVLHALVIFSVLGVFGCFHYFLWGRSLSQEVAEEREQQEESSTETGIWTPDGPHRPRHY